MIVDQVNSLTMPGILAAYLAGRVTSFSLPWRDWLRLELGYAVDLPVYKPKNQDKEDAVDIEYIQSGRQTHISHLANQDVTGSQQTGRTLFKNIGRLLHTYAEHKDKFHEVADSILKENPSVSPSSRRVELKDLVRAINALIERTSGKVSSAQLLLAKWVVAHVVRKVKGRNLSVKTAMRYLDALERPFVEVGYDVDILREDDDGITIFYTDIIESLTVDDTRYAAARLRIFTDGQKETTKLRTRTGRRFPKHFPDNMFLRVSSPSRNTSARSPF